MTNNELLYQALGYVVKHKNSPPLLSDAYIKAMAELNLIKDGWDIEITEDGMQLLNLLRNVYEKY